jgi:hypothetical protein
MAGNEDRFPGTRAVLPAMAKIRGHVFSSENPLPFGVPQTEADSLANLSLRLHKDRSPVPLSEGCPGIHTLDLHIRPADGRSIDMTVGCGTATERKSIQQRS